LQFFGDGQLIAGSGDGTLQLFGIHEATCKQMLKAEFLGSVNGLTISKDGSFSLVGTDKGFIYKVSNADFSKALVKETHTSEVVSVTYPKKVSDRFITASTDGSLRLWDANDYIAITSCAVFS